MSPARHDGSVPQSTRNATPGTGRFEMTSHDLSRGARAFATLLALLLGALPVTARAADMTSAQAGAHASHTQANRAHAPLSCAECHAPVCAPSGSKNVVFGQLAGGTATWNAGTCSNVYCHASASPKAWTWVDTSVVPPLDQECRLCHGYPPASPHPQNSSCRTCHAPVFDALGNVDVSASGKHLNGAIDFTGGGSGLDCSTCHGYAPATGAHATHFGLVNATSGATYDDTRTIQQRYPAGAPANVYAFGCGICHSVDAARHMNNGVDVRLYEVAAPAGTLKARASASAAYAGGTCSGVYCHGNGTTTPAWSSAAPLACNACHGQGNADGRPDYASGTPKANSHGLHASYACSTCHYGTTTDGRTIANRSLHVNGNYDVTPGPGVAFAYTYAATGGSCSSVSCHFGGGSTWGPEQSHLATLGTGDVMVFEQANIDHGDAFTMTMDCATCHYSSLVAQHASRCDLCHQGANPAGPIIGSWDKGCSQCHPSIHVGQGSDHYGVWWNSSASCDLCHTQGGNFPGPADRCTNCHSPEQTAGMAGDREAPTTTSDAQPSYLGAATIRLTAVDAGGSGLSQTLFRLDSGGWTVGTSVRVAAPASGTVPHTLWFYSTDAAGNVEATKSASFTVTAVDATPPTTTSSFSPTAGAAYRTAAVSLTATDAGSGVKATYYAIDAGSFVQGTSFSVTGDGLHTFRWYSVDNANNTETTHVSSQFRIDTVAPVTSSSVVPGSTYTGGQVFTLSASDTSGSGVASTWYRVDAGALTSGTAVTVAPPASGSAAHTLYWYSIDAAGNQEAQKSASFTLQAPVVDVTPPVTTSSFNPSAGSAYNSARTVTLTPTDAGSGVKATYYRIDSGAFVQGTSISIATQGLHTFSWYSVDNANNTETTHVSNAFWVDTTAPVTTSSAIATAYTGGQVFTFSANDTGGSGVASTWYRLNGTGAFTSGSAVTVAAPASGTASHTLEWYSIDAAGNQEATRSVAFSVAAAVVPPGTVTLQFRTNASFGGWSYIYWEARDADNNVLCSYENDDPAHPSSMWLDCVLPSGQPYVMYGAWGPMPDGPDEDVAERAVTAAEAAPGATVTWWWY
jgi:predicted CxxxxCH...CXXCH cytochrome family protein